METRKIGSLDVSVVGLGCNNFGGRLDAVATKIVVDAALDAGINFFDTADIYGKTKSEEYLGQALGRRRDDIVLATKFGMEVDADHKGAKPEYIHQAVEASLRRLGTDRIDLYQLHRPDPGVPIADTLGALNELVQAGKVREIGCSNFTVQQLREAKAAVKNGEAAFVSVQNEYSLLQPEAGTRFALPADAPDKEGSKADVLEEAAREGLAFIPYFPLASGLLTGKYRKVQPLPEGTRIQSGSDWLTDENLDTVEALAQYAETRGHKILELAFGWLLSQRAVASVIAGATKPEQIRSNAAASQWKLTDAEVTEVNALVSRNASAIK